MKRSLFQHQTGLTLRVAICLALSLIMMAVDSKYDQLNTVRSGIEVIITPVRYVVNLPFRGLEFASQTFSTHRHLLSENKRLNNENFSLRTQQQKMNVLAKENERLRALLGSSVSVAEQSIVAELVKVSMNPYGQQFLINKGTQHGVFQGQPVINQSGIIGQIMHSTPYNATVLLISDSQHDIPVLSNRSGLRTIARGSGHSNELDLLYIPNNADIKVGDLMISSGLGGRFPSKYPVATVTHIERSPSEPFAKIIAKPNAELDKIKEVLLIWSEQTPKPTQPESKPNE